MMERDSWLSLLDTRLSPHWIYEGQELFGP